MVRGWTYAMVKLVCTENIVILMGDSWRAQLRTFKIATGWMSRPALKVALSKIWVTASG